MSELLQWVLGISSVLACGILTGIWNDSRSLKKQTKDSIEGFKDSIREITEAVNKQLNHFHLQLTEFRVEMQHTNASIKEMLQKLSKLDEHQDKITRIEEREKSRDQDLNYFRKWREDHDKIHATNSRG